MVVSVLKLTTFLVIIPYTIQHNNYLHRTYIVVGITSNLKMIYCIQGVCGGIRRHYTTSCEGLEDLRISVSTGSPVTNHLWILGDNSIW